MPRNQLTKRRIWRPLHGRAKFSSSFNYNSSSEAASAQSLDSHYTNPSASSPPGSIVHYRCGVTAPQQQQPPDDELPTAGRGVFPFESVSAGACNFSRAINCRLESALSSSSLVANCYTTCSSALCSQPMNHGLRHGPADRLPRASPPPPLNYIGSELEDAACGACKRLMSASSKMSPTYSYKLAPESRNATHTKHSRGFNHSLVAYSEPPQLRPAQLPTKPKVNSHRHLSCCSAAAVTKVGSLGAHPTPAVAPSTAANQPAHLCNLSHADHINSTGGCSSSGPRQQQQEQQVVVENNCEAGGSKLETPNEKHINHQISIDNNLGWSDITMRYRTMQQDPSGAQQGLGRSKRQVWFKLKHSCFFQLLLSAIHFVFPILSSFKGYTLPDDLLTDITSGITVAVLHIPQGMAYGPLAGVEPINGLYVSLIPVLLMALMSSSRHVSFGTFAIISIMLASAVDSFKANYRLQLSAANQTSELAAVVLVNNHQPPVAELVPAPAQHESLLRNLFITNSIQQDSSNHNRFLASGLPAAGSGELTGLPAGSNSIADYEMPTNTEILATICLVVGLIQILMATMRLGVLSLVLSEQVISGFTTAAALHVITSQLSPLFDLNLGPVEEGPFKICRVWVKFAVGMCAGFNKYTAAISIISMLSLLFCKQILEPKLKRYSKYYSFIPSELILMFILIFCSWCWKFQANHGVRVIGSIPTELPTLNPPRLDIAPLVLHDALTIAMFTFAMNFSLAQVYAKRFKYKIKSNQELFAIGTTNCISSFFSCFPCGSSLSRTAMKANLSVKSPLCPLVSCACILSIICYLAPLLYDLPYCTLSCIVVVALMGVLAQSKEVAVYWQHSKLDALVWCVTFVSVITFNVTLGLMIGVVASLLVILVRLFTPDYSILGRLSGTDLFADIDAFSECSEIEHIKILRFNSALCYLNQTIFKSCVEKLLPHRAGSRSLNFLCRNQAEIERERIERALRIKFLIIDCSAFSYCDHSGMETLIDIIEEFEERNVRVLLASCPLKLIYMIERMKHPKLLLKNIYPTIPGAVNRANSMMINQTQISQTQQSSEPIASYKFTPFSG